MHSLCRVCLEQQGDEEKSVALFQAFVCGVAIGTLLNKLFGIDILEDDNLPQTICERCFLELQAVVVFKEKLLKSDVALRAAYNNIKTRSRDEVNLLEETVVSCSATTPTTELADHEYTTIDIISNRCCVCGNVIYESEQTYLLQQDEHGDGLPDSGNSYNKSVCTACYERINNEEENDNDGKTVNTDEVICAPSSDGVTLLQKSAGEREKHGLKTQRICCVTHCKEMFCNESELLQHAKDAHLLKIRWNRERQQLGKSYMCDVCCRSFNSLKNLRIHQFVRTNQQGKQYACQKCPFRTASKALLIIHQRSHTGERPFGCKLCEKRFLSELNLKNHQICHQAERLFVCSYCLKQFARKRNMEEHIRSCHSDEKPYHCDACGAKFKVQQHLRLHRRLHTGEKPYKCSLCPNSFYHISDRKRHELSHTGEKPYSCETCGLSYTRKRSLTIHERTHTGERPFSCKDCGQTFKQASLMKRHMIRHQNTECSGSIDNGSVYESVAKNDKSRQEQFTIGETFLIEGVYQVDQA